MKDYKRCKCCLYLEYADDASGIYLCSNSEVVKQELNYSAANFSVEVPEFENGCPYYHDFD